MYLSNKPVFRVYVFSRYLWLYSLSLIHVFTLLIYFFYLVQRSQTQSWLLTSTWGWYILLRWNKVVVVLSYCKLIFWQGIHAPPPSYTWHFPHLKKYIFFIYFLLNSLPTFLLAPLSLKACGFQVWDLGLKMSL